MIEEVEAAMEEMQFSVALSAIWKFVSRTNKYIDETTPWAAVKDEARQEELARTMSYLAEKLTYYCGSFTTILNTNTRRNLSTIRNPG